MSASSSATLDGDHNHTARRDKKMSSINGGGDDHHNLPTQDTENPADFPRGDSVGSASIPPKPDLESSYREKQVKPNKVYIGGLPEHARREDLQNCFGEIGTIAAIELKAGYGFVEFDTREAAEMSVSKYHEGVFMGNKIRVELSRGGGRTAKYSNDPLSCFRCGQVGHWARECPHHPGPPPGHGMPRRNDAPLIDRISRGRDYSPPPPRDSRDSRDSRDARDARDPRYDYPPRDYRRPPSPNRDYYLPPPSRSRYDDYPRDRDRAPPPSPGDYRSGRYPEPAYRGPPPPAATPYPAYDRYDRYSRDSKYAGYPPPPPPPPVPAARPRTPPRYRDDYPPPRDYDYRDRERGRPATPPRYPDYPRGTVTPDRYLRRSASPPPRSAAYDYPPTSTQNGHYPTTPPGAPPPPPLPSRSSRDYGRTGRDGEIYRRA